MLSSPPCCPGFYFGRPVWPDTPFFIALLYFLLFLAYTLLSRSAVCRDGCGERRPAAENGAKERGVEFVSGVKRYLVGRTFSTTIIMKETV